MIKKAQLFGGTDGHGLIMTALSERALKSEGYEVSTICSYNSNIPKPEEIVSPGDYGTKIPCVFWKYTFPYYVENSDNWFDLIVIVDIPFPEPDNRCPSLSIDGIIQKIELLINKGSQVIIIDHHKNSFTHYGNATKAGVEVIISSTSIFTHYGTPDDYSFRWGRIGAICDRDNAVLPIAKSEEILAARIDVAKKDVVSVLEAIRRDDIPFFDKFSPEIPTSDEVRIFENLVYIPRLVDDFGFKQLGQVCEDNNKNYAIGISYQHPDMPVILLITDWKSDVLPVALKLGLTRFRGHENALNLNYTPELLDELINRFNSPSNSGTVTGLDDKPPENFYGYVAAFLKQVKIPFFLTLHKWGHIEHVISYGRTLGSLFGLSEHEQKILDWACLLHDIGYGIERTNDLEFEMIRTYHHEFSYKMIREWHGKGKFFGFLDDDEVLLIADMCLRHRKNMPLPGTGKDYLYVLLRVADAMDNDKRRGQKNDEGVVIGELRGDLSPESIIEFDSHLAVEGLRLKMQGMLLTFEIVVNNMEKAAHKINDIKLEIEPFRKYFELNVEVVFINVVDINEL